MSYCFRLRADSKSKNEKRKEDSGNNRDERDFHCSSQAATSDSRVLRKLRGGNRNARFEFSRDDVSIRHTRVDAANRSGRGSFDGKRKRAFVHLRGIAAASGDMKTR